jgi:hypothetical protein
VNFIAKLDAVAPDKEMGMCVLRYDTATKALTIKCHHNLMTATVAHIHGPAGVPPATGAPFFPFTKCTSATTCMVIDETQVLTAEQEGWLFTDMTYVNIHSTSKPAGHIRGQVYRSGTTVPGLAAELTEGQAGVTGTGKGGIAYFSWTTTTMLKMWLIHNLANPVTAAHIHNTTGSGVLYPLMTSCVANWTCTQDIDASAANKNLYINLGMTYINIHTGANPNGEIRGQIRKVEAQTQPLNGDASSLVVGLPQVLVALAAVVAIFVQRA